MKHFLVIMLIVMSVVPATLAGALAHCAPENCGMSCCCRAQIISGHDGELVLTARHGGCGCSVTDESAPVVPLADLATAYSEVFRSPVAIVVHGLPGGSESPSTGFFGFETAHAERPPGVPVYLLVCSLIS